MPWIKEGNEHIISRSDRIKKLISLFRKKFHKKIGEKKSLARLTLKQEREYNKLRSDEDCAKYLLSKIDEKYITQKGKEFINNVFSTLPEGITMPKHQHSNKRVDSGGIEQYANVWE